MVMQQSDSMSSMGSAIVRIDSNKSPPQATSHPNLHHDSRRVRAVTDQKKAAGAMTTFVVNEDENDADDYNSSDEESVIQRANDADAQSDDDESVL